MALVNRDSVLNANWASHTATRTQLATAEYRKQGLTPAPPQLQLLVLKNRTKIQSLEKVFWFSGTLSLGGSGPKHRRFGDLDDAVIRPIASMWAMPFGWRP